MASVFRSITPGLTPNEIGKQLVEDVRTLRNDIGLPGRLQDVGVKQEQLQNIAEDSVKSGMWKFNPRQASIEDIYQLINQIF